MHCKDKCSDELGAALLLVLLALFLFSLLGLYMTLDATTSVNISENYESQLQATYAALAGLNHAAALLRGLDFSSVLKGPDGVYNGSSSYKKQAKTFQFRLPLPLLAAQTLNILDPSSDVAAIPDDGLISTGFYNGIGGVMLIPKTGISLTAPNPYAPGEILISRYFVKVADNNGDPSEIAGDPSDNPFIDGDGIVIVRSVGVAKTIPIYAGQANRRNSIAVFEARFKRLSTWNAGPALVVLGAGVNAAFSGTYNISGGAYPGIGAIDTSIADPPFPDQTIRSAIGMGGIITGGGLPNPSVSDITGQVSSNPDQSLLLSASYLWDFVYTKAPQIADNYFNGDQSWLNGSAPYLGAYDASSPWNAPIQDPKITVVNGNLLISGSVSGAGLLIITGNFAYSGAFAFNGLVLVIGVGNFAAAGAGSGIEGGLFVANLSNAGGEISFGMPAISIGSASRISSNQNAVQMAVRLLPVSQISFREIAGSDP